jgi:Protein of unknown function (DUF3341)
MIRNFKIGIFDDEERFLSSIRSLIEQEFLIYDVYTPYPVHEVFHLLKRRSRLPTAAYFFGLFGIIATLAFLYYTSVIDWPLVYGGKPFNSFPSFIVVTIIVTILTVTIASLVLFSARSKLFPGRENTIFDQRATNDKFVIVVEIADHDFSKAKKSGIIMEEQGAIEVLDKEFESVKA